MLTALQAPNLSIYLLPCVSKNLQKMGMNFGSLSYVLSLV
ncbi:hypothetical protein SLEP1_g60428 [Rubroshorea leprosula]|uniref:Uncharacterized protein n=1 Tax=Rubroshorea leprosula TaxID=152421 RepID=A0AAV5MV90_9ROSI|nr:hypothetical protein SLEP1_g60428 [Rubroshorea leprosula]